MSYIVSLLSITGWVWTGLFFLWLAIRLIRASREEERRGFAVIHAPARANEAPATEVEVSSDRA